MRTGVSVTELLKGGMREKASVRSQGFGFKGLCRKFLKEDLLNSMPVEAGGSKN